MLQSYPRHLLNARHSFDTIIEECYDFPFPVDHDLTKSHFYAWTTGLATLPLASTDDGKFPCGVAVITSNHFGEVFWQVRIIRMCKIYAQCYSRAYYSFEFISLE